jgi:hypothetical protein
VEVGVKRTWVLSGLDVSEAMEVLRGRAIVVDVDLSLCLSPPLHEAGCG